MCSATEKCRISVKATGLPFLYVSSCRTPFWGNIWNPLPLHYKDIASQLICNGDCWHFSAQSNVYPWGTWTVAEENLNGFHVCVRLYVFGSVWLRCVWFGRNSRAPCFFWVWPNNGLGSGRHTCLIAKLGTLLLLLGRCWHNGPSQMGSALFDSKQSQHPSHDTARAADTEHFVEYAAV